MFKVQQLDQQCQLWFHLVIKQLQPSVIQIPSFSILLCPSPFSLVPFYSSSSSIHSSLCYCLMDGKRFLCRAPDWPPGSRPVFGRWLCAACPRSQDQPENVNHRGQTHTHVYLCVCVCECVYTRLTLAVYSVILVPAGLLSSSCRVLGVLQGPNSRNLLLPQGCVQSVHGRLGLAGGGRDGMRGGWTEAFGFSPSLWATHVAKTSTL